MLLTGLVAVLLAVLIFSFGMIVVVGAPYVPTFRADIDILLAKLKLPEGSSVVDLGSGDGRVVLEAVKRGYKATGYELNPILWAISNWRLRAHKNGRVKLQSLWRADLTRANMVFIFGVGHIMPRLEKKLTDELEPGSYFVSNAFRLQDKKLSQKIRSFYVYKF